VLIDGDLRRPLVHRAFDISQDPGLTDVLIGRVSSREAIRPDVAANLDVLPAGASPPNPSELLGSGAMHALIGDLRRTYDYIVIDTPPTLPVTDAAVVATTADATILVVKSGDTEETAAQRAVDMLNRVNARIAGAVLNGIDQRRDHYYTYYSYRERDSRTPVKSLFSRLSSSL
jgi:capsular exopolysaccharide synthesis family protein